MSNDIYALIQCNKKVLTLLSPLFVIYLFFSFFKLSDGTYNLLNGTLPIYYIVCLLLPVSRLMRVLPESIWTPSVWLLVSFSVFFGFGPLVNVYGSEEAQQELFYSAIRPGAEEVFKANMLAAYGTIFLLIGWFFWDRRRLSRLANNSFRLLPTPYFKPINVALAFVLLGGIFRHIVFYPAEWGFLDITIPGSLSSMAYLVDLGFGLLAFCMAKSRNRLLYRIFIVLFLPHIFICLLSLDKSDLVTALMLPALGMYSVNRSRIKLGVFFACIAIVFSLSQPWVLHGRKVIQNNTGSIFEASHKERLELLAGYLSGERVVGDKHEVGQSWWLRLNYTGAQSFAMSLYDNGSPGDTMKDAWMYFIPRVVWPSKPIMEGPGKKFYYLITGNDYHTFTGLTVFGDLYWQWGWLGVFFVSPLIGALFSSMSWRSFMVIKKRNFVMFPLVMLALNIAMLGMSKFLVNGVIAPLPIYYAYLLAFVSFSVLLSGFRKSYL